MNKNPLVNAGAAALYIAGVASFMSYAPQILGKSEGVGIPIAMLSLLTLSAAVMAYLFFYEPLRLLLGGDPQGAVTLFGKTLGVFALFTALIFGALFISTLF